MSLARTCIQLAHTCMQFAPTCIQLARTFTMKLEHALQAHTHATCMRLHWKIKCQCLYDWPINQPRGKWCSTQRTILSGSSMGSASKEHHLKIYILSKDTIVDIGQPLCWAPPSVRINHDWTHKRDLHRSTAEFAVGNKEKNTHNDNCVIAMASGMLVGHVTRRGRTDTLRFEILTL